MDNNKLQSQELDEMRRQLNLLNDKLGEEKIVSERLLKESMNSKMGWIKTLFWVELLVALPFIAWFFAAAKSSGSPLANYSWWSYAALLLLTSVDIYFDYRVNIAPLRELDYHGDNLVGTVGKLVRMKRERKMQAYVGIAASIAVLGWMLIECWMNVGPTAAARHLLLAMTLIGCAGALAGGILGVVLISRMQRTNDRMISQINEIIHH